MFYIYYNTVIHQAIICLVVFDDSGVTLTVWWCGICVVLDSPCSVWRDVCLMLGNWIGQSVPQPWHIHTHSHQRLSSSFPKLSRSLLIMVRIFSSHIVYLHLPSSWFNACGKHGLSLLWKLLLGTFKNFGVSCNNI